MYGGAPRRNGRAMVTHRRAIIPQLMRVEANAIASCAGSAGSTLGAAEPLKVSLLWRCQSPVVRRAAMRPFDLFPSKVEIQPRIFQRWNSYSLKLSFNLTPRHRKQKPSSAGGAGQAVCAD